MNRPPLTLFLVYGLVGLVIAGGVVTFSEITSKVVPVFPRNGRLMVDFTTSTDDAGEVSSSTSQGSSLGNFTLSVTSDSIMVHRSGEFNVTSGWSSVLNSTRTVTLQPERKVSMGTLVLPEGNITLVRIDVVNATLQRTPGGAWENVRVPSGKLEIPVSAEVRAQVITSIVVDIHLVCPALNADSGSTHECTITPVLHVED